MHMINLLETGRSWVCMRMHLRMIMSGSAGAQVKLKAKLASR